jgi:hypothetical protein
MYEPTPGSLGIAPRVTKEDVVPPDELIIDIDFDGTDCQPVSLCLLAGSAVHARYAIEHSGLSEGELDNWYEKHYAAAPAVVQGWSRLAREAIEPIDLLQPSPEDRRSSRLHEVRLYLGKKSFQAARVLQEALISEQMLGNGSSGPLEAALRTTPHFLPPGAEDGQFDGLVDECEEIPLSPDEIRQYARDARTHHFAHGGDLIMCQTTRADIVNLSHDSDDFETWQIAAALERALNSGSAYDPNKLVDMRFPFMTHDGLTDISGVEMAHRAAMLIRDNRLAFEVLDIKTLSHIGKKYEGLGTLWSEYNGNLPNIFSDDNLMEVSPTGKQLRNIWLPMEYDVAKTLYVFRNFFRIVECEHEQLYGGNYMLAATALDDIMRQLRVGVILVDFDIRRGDKPTVLNGNETLLDYDTVPRFSEAGVPDNITVGRRDIPYFRVQELWNLWETQVYYRNQMMGRLVLQGMESSD